MNRLLADELALASQILRSGNLAGAEARLRAMLQRDPRNGPALHLLARVLDASGRCQEALSAIDSATELVPDNPSFQLTRARIQMQAKLPGLAIGSYKKSIELQPSIDAVSELSEIYLLENHPQIALDLLLDASRGEILSQQPHRLIAQALTELQEYDAAEDRWSLAVRFADDPQQIVFKRAAAETAAGRFLVAEKLLFNAIDDGYDFPNSFYLLTRARHMTRLDAALVERAQRVSQAHTLEPTSLQKLHYGLGKSFDDLGDFESAIGHFDEANRIGFELSPRKRNFNRNETQVFVDFQIRYYTNRKIAELTRKGSASELPLFIVGMLRSGTTLTENILGAHSRIKPGGEQMFWTQRAREYTRWNYQGLQLDWNRIGRLRDEYLSLIGQESVEERHVIDKNPTNIHLATLLHCIFPQARIVHIVRNPVDNLLSLWMTPLNEEVAYSSNRDNLVFFYKDYLRLFAHLREVLPEHRFQTYEYESITSEPVPTISKLLDWLQVEQEPACFQPEKNLRTVLTPSVYQVRQPIHSGSQRRWKNYERWLGPFAELLDV